MRRDWTGALIAACLAAYTVAMRHRDSGRGPVARSGDGAYGRDAEEPQEIPQRGWRDVLKRLYADIGNDHLSLMAAGIAFYGILSLTPTATALVACYGLVFDPGDVQHQLATLKGIVPDEALRLVGRQLAALASASSSRLSIGLGVSLALALWAANSATSAMISALNVIYVEEEKRGFMRYYAEALLLTLCLILFSAVSFALIAILPAIFGFLPFGPASKTLVAWLRWPLLLALATIGLAIIYRYAPSRNEPRWSWVSWGAVAATLLWVGGSALFSLYVGEFATYDKTYGRLGAVIVLLMWLWLSAFAVLLGAELNAEMEHQTARDTTDPPKKPMGERGAFVADTVAPHG
jgi:membrane protein